MLVLSRNCDTVIRIGPDIRVKVLSIRKQRVKLGVEAPSSVRVWRDEIREKPLLHDAAASPNGNGQAGGRQFPILVVEDDLDHARLITKVLLDNHLPQVTTVSTGTAAIEALAGDETVSGDVGPRLVLLDLNLPDISGLEVLRWIRAHGSFRTLPVVVLSVTQEESLVADCLEAGANAFVAKSACYGEFRDSVARMATFWKSDCRIPRSCGQTPDRAFAHGS